MVVGCASLRGLHRLHAYEVYSTSKTCCRVAQLQPKMELTLSVAALGLLPSRRRPPSLSKRSARLSCLAAGRAL